MAQLAWAKRILVIDTGSTDRTLEIIGQYPQAVLPAPVLMFFYVLFIKRCLLEGWSGWYYTLQRSCAEAMLSIELLDRRLRSAARPDSGQDNGV